MKIYTKKGDGGKTSLIGGTRVAKHHIRVEAYGTVDELNVCIGMLADQYIDDRLKRVLRSIQVRLFNAGALLAADPQKSKMILPEIEEEDILALEHEIDGMEETLKPLKNFILPGGDIAISVCHLARVVCRRAERVISQLDEQSKVAPIIIVYFNRLSDFLFVAARKIAHDKNVDEIEWKPDN